MKQLRLSNEKDKDNKKQRKQTDSPLSDPLYIPSEGVPWNELNSPRSVSGDTDIPSSDLEKKPQRAPFSTDLQAGV